MYGGYCSAGRRCQYRSDRHKSRTTRRRFRADSHEYYKRLEAWVKTYSFDITGVHVESDKSKNLTLRAQPDEGLEPGKYEFGIEAKTAGGKLTSPSQVTIW